jgi:hypothetical protein
MRASDNSTSNLLEKKAGLDQKRKKAGLKVERLVLGGID